MASSHLVIFSTSGKFITKFNVLRWIGLSETLSWTGARGRILITLRSVVVDGKGRILLTSVITEIRKAASIPDCVRHGER